MYTQVSVLLLLCICASKGCLLDCSQKVNTKGAWTEAERDGVNIFRCTCINTFVVLALLNSLYLSDSMISYKQAVWFVPYVAWRKIYPLYLRGTWSPKSWTWDNSKVQSNTLCGRAWNPSSTQVMGYYFIIPYSLSDTCAFLCLHFIFFLVLLLLSEFQMSNELLCTIFFHF